MKKAPVVETLITVVFANTIAFIFTILIAKLACGAIIICFTGTHTLRDFDIMFVSTTHIA